MKFFWELRSCLGGAATTEGAGGGRQSAAPGGRVHETADNQRLLKKAKSNVSGSHWKPKLQAISEDIPMSQVVGSGVDRRPPAKVRPKSTAKATPPRCHVEDYWKSSNAMALPAFSPTPFMI